MRADLSPYFFGDALTITVLELSSVAFVDSADSDQTAYCLVTFYDSNKFFKIYIYIF